VARLADDHANARLLADRLAASKAIGIDVEAVRTNIVVFRLTERAGDGHAIPDAAAFVASCRARGVLLNAFGARVVRAVTHLDVSRDDCLRAADVMVAVAEGN